MRIENLYKFGGEYSCLRHNQAVKWIGRGVTYNRSDINYINSSYAFPLAVVPRF